VRLDPLIALQFFGPSSRKTASRVANIRGSASSIAGISRVEYRVGKRGHYRLAAGTERWQAKLKLKHGMNHISLRAFSASGERSLPVGINIRTR
jgi:hypothetical protein